MTNNGMAAVTAFGIIYGLLPASRCRARNKMPRRIGNETTQITLRLERDVLDRAERLASKTLTLGMKHLRSDVLRAAIEQGLDRMEAAFTRKRVRRSKP